MANKQHIYKGAGEPWDVLGGLTGIAGHHYLNESDGSVYIANHEDSWVKVNDRSAIGIFSRLEVQSAPIGPTGAIPEPSGPMLWINESNGDAYLSVGTGGPISPVWSWKKMTLT